MPRAKRSKQYKRLMSQYQMNFGFREPYQVLCDSQFLEAAIRSKMDINHIMKTTLHGSTKLLITQCSMRWLYARTNEPGIGAVIDFAKEHVERRRCGHHPTDYPEPLKESECVHSVVDPSSKGVNKHRYVCALNDDEIRASLRTVQVVPLLYIRRSVLIMEPASSNTVKARSRDEKAKFTAELKSPAAVKRKRELEESDGEGDGKGKEGAEQTKPEKKKKKPLGRKEPNPLSVKKKKKVETPGKTVQAAETETAKPDDESQPATTGESEEVSKGKRRRKHKSKTAAALGNDGDAPTENPNQTETLAGDE